MSIKQIPSFVSYEEAEKWMIGQVDDSCIDNFRFAHQNSPVEMEKYADKKSDGCCGSFDSTVIVGGEHCKIGCNYGH